MRPYLPASIVGDERIDRGWVDPLRFRGRDGPLDVRPDRASARVVGPAARRGQQQREDGDCVEAAGPRERHPAVVAAADDADRAAAEDSSGHEWLPFDDSIRLADPDRVVQPWGIRLVRTNHREEVRPVAAQLRVPHTDSSARESPREAFAS